MKPFYFPIESGIYEVAPGLFPMGQDFGNGPQDSKFFQFDDDFARVREEKLAARSEDVSKYFKIWQLNDATERDATETIVGLLVKEWPEHFSLFDNVLECRLTGERLTFDRKWKLSRVENGPTPAYRNGLDALFSQVQEDGALLSVEESWSPREAKNWLSMLHVMQPSHWDPREKIGRDFATFHQPVPGFEKLAKAQFQIAQAMIHRGPFVRFVWSFVTDTRLNHHPEPPPGADAVEWRGRTFDRSRENPFYLRVERQSILGLPKSNASLFLIRLSFIEGTRIRADATMRSKLVSALKSMSPESRAYKGVDTCFDDLIGWLGG